MQSDKRFALSIVNKGSLPRAECRFPLETLQQIQTRFHSQGHSIHSSGQASFYEDLTEPVFIIMGHFSDGVVEVVGNRVQNLRLLHIT